jgi:hypothetical protein
MCIEGKWRISQSCSSCVPSAICVSHAGFASGEAGLPQNGSGGGGVLPVYEGGPLLPLGAVPTEAAAQLPIAALDLPVRALGAGTGVSGGGDTAQLL